MSHIWKKVGGGKGGGVYLMSALFYNLMRCNKASDYSARQEVQMYIDGDYGCVMFLMIDGNLLENNLHCLHLFSSSTLVHNVPFLFYGSSSLIFMFMGWPLLIIDFYFQIGHHI